MKCALSKMTLAVRIAFDQLRRLEPEAHTKLSPVITEERLHAPETVQVDQYCAEIEDGPMPRDVQLVRHGLLLAAWLLRLAHEKPNVLAILVGDTTVEYISLRSLSRRGFLQALLDCLGQFPV